MTSSILLRQGTVLVHDASDHIIPLRDTDVLVIGDTIAQIGAGIELPPGHTTEVLDCKGKIICPGFIDTHRHLWQTQLKGRHADHGLVEYMITGNMMSYAYTPSDVYWGQLSGCLESLHAGTTTILDHAHIAYSPEHATSALQGTTDSGIRSIFAYQVPIRLSQWDKTSCIANRDTLPDWALNQLADLAGKYNQTPNGRVEAALGFDTWFLPKDMVLDAFSKLRKSGVRLITTHVSRNAFFGLQSPIPLFQSYGLLRPPYPASNATEELPFLHLSHCNNLAADELSLIATTGTPIASTPDTESQMGMGYPLALHPEFRSRTSTSNAGLGVDCHSNNPSSIILQARALLHLTRVEHNEPCLQEDKFPAGDVVSSSEEAFNLATIRGARSLGLGDQVGSIDVGKKADLVVFDASGSVGMLSATEHDPVVSVLRFSEAADIELVIVDGTVRKRDGKLVAVASSQTGTSLPWRGVAEEVRRSQKDIQGRIDGCSIEKGREMLLKTFYVDQSKLVDATI